MRYMDSLPTIGHRLPSLDALPDEARRYVDPYLDDSFRREEHEYAKIPGKFGGQVPPEATEPGFDFGRTSAYIEQNKNSYRRVRRANDARAGARGVPMRADARAPIYASDALAANPNMLCTIC